MMMMMMMMITNITLQGGDITYSGSCIAQGRKHSYTSVRTSTPYSRC